MIECDRDVSGFPVEGATGPKRVLFVDRNPVLSEVVSSQLSATGVLDCGFLSSDADLMSVVRDRRPDVLVLDPAHLDLRHDYDLVDFAREMRSVSPITNLLAYSFKVNDTVLRAIVDAGFRGCVSKTSQLRRLEIALAVVLDGGVYFDQSFGSHLGPMMSRSTTSGGLSEREKEVLVGLARGLSAKQIAHNLNISNKTVDTYRARATKKLDLTDKAKIVGYVIGQGWMN